MQKGCKLPSLLRNPLSPHNMAGVVAGFHKEAFVVVSFFCWSWLGTTKCYIYCFDTVFHLCVHSWLSQNNRMLLGSPLWTKFCFVSIIFMQEGGFSWSLLFLRLSNKWSLTSGAQRTRKCGTASIPTSLTSCSNWSGKLGQC